MDGSKEIVRNSLKEDLQKANEEYYYLKTQPWDYLVMGTEVEYLAKKYSIYPETLLVYMGLEEDPDKDDEWIVRRDGKGWGQRVRNPSKPPLPDRESPSRYMFEQQPTNRFADFAFLWGVRGLGVSITIWFILCMTIL